MAAGNAVGKNQTKQVWFSKSIDAHMYATIIRVGGIIHDSHGGLLFPLTTTLRRRVYSR
jgi:hypothetical protein